MKKKPEIVVAENAGFCFGVRRAVDMAEKALEKNGDKKVFCWGELIHNPRVVEDLKKRGMRIVDTIEKVEDDSMFIVRSHGIPQDKLKKIKDPQRKIKIIDTTCPFVEKAQKSAIDFQKKGFQVVIFGDPEHVEVIGINSCVNYCGIVSDGELSEKDEEKISESSKIGILSQTTRKKEEFENFAKKVKTLNEKVEVRNTICMETSRKQGEVRKMINSGDILFVVGGKNSSNTGKLAEIGRKIGVRTYHIENSQEIKKDWLKNCKGKIVITAGASTPDVSIENTRQKILKLIS
ncbi:MAG: 4-hydroxy-3-methylbut-2-enyl diphosphate reductase [Patescibacteria group bacterium]